MRLVFELSGEHPTLPRAELAAVLRSLGETTSIPEGRVVAVDSAVDPAVLGRRLALTHFVHEEIVAGDFGDILDAAGGLAPGAQTFSVRVKSYVTCRGKQEMERRVADRIKGAVDLVNPGVEYLVLITANGHRLVRRIAQTDRSAFERRRPMLRPFFHPSTLHPRFARALVNLSRCPPGGTIADPFCGTGGILLEAALSGFQARGLDASAKMIAGAMETLAAFGVTADLHVGDVALLREVEGVQGVVTDPPYGRAASTQREPVESLYRRFFEAAASHTRRGAVVSVILPAAEHVELGQELLRLEEVHVQRVHRSLERRFCVFSAR